MLWFLLLWPHYLILKHQTWTCLLHYLRPLRHLPLWSTALAVADLSGCWFVQVMWQTQRVVDRGIKTRRQHLPAAHRAVLNTLPTGSRAVAPATGLPPAKWDNLWLIFFVVKKNKNNKPLTFTNPNQSQSLIYTASLQYFPQKAVQWQLKTLSSWRLFTFSPEGFISSAVLGPVATEQHFCGITLTWTTEDSSHKHTNL